MRHLLKLPLSALALLLLLASVATAQDGEAEEEPSDNDKIAQTGMKFLNVAPDPRAAALGNSTTALTGGAEMLFVNPAGMAWANIAQPGGDAMLAQTNWIADITHNHAAVGFRPGSNIGVFGATMAFVDYGELEGTIRADNDQGYIDLGTFKPTAFAMGVGYARALSSRFSVGAHIKYVSQDLTENVDEIGNDGGFVYGENRASTLAYDFGVQYRTGFESLVFAAAARNFSPDVTFEEESFQLPLTLQIGVAMDVFDLVPAMTGTLADRRTHSLMLSLEAKNPRDFNEQIRLGGEYTFLDLISLRAGYGFPADIEGISLGAGIHQTLAGVGLGADYAYTDFGPLQAVHRVAVRFSL